MMAGRSIFRDFWLEERGARHGVVMVLFKTAFTYLEIWGRNRWAPQQEGSLGVYEAQILPSAHAGSPPCHLQVGRALGRRPVLTAPPTARRRWRSRPQPPKPEATRVQLPYRRTQEHSEETQKASYKRPPCPAGCRPACPIVGFSVPSFLPVMCLNLRIQAHRLWQRNLNILNRGNSMERIPRWSDNKFLLKTRHHSSPPLSSVSVSDWALGIPCLQLDRVWVSEWH
jgi:hypothetical protein